jgi:hypothetical protein
MVPLTDDKCCRSCRRDPNSPCPDLIACLTEGPLCHQDPACKARREDRAIRLRREVIDRPAIFVGTGTCGLGAGAAKTLAAARKYLADRALDAAVVEVGCIGLCAAEL